MRTKTLLKLSILPTLLYLFSPVVMASTHHSVPLNKHLIQKLQIPGNLQLLPPNQLAKSIAYHRRAKLERLDSSVKKHILNNQLVS